MSTMDDPAMQDPMFQVGHADGGTPDERAIAGEMSRAELAATREEHVRLAEGALVRADALVAGGIHLFRRTQDLFAEFA